MIAMMMIIVELIGMIKLVTYDLNSMIIVIFLEILLATKEEFIW